MKNQPFGNRYGAVWTNAEDAALRKHLFEGLSSSVAAAEINKEFGTNYTRNAVIGRSVREKMPRGTLQKTKPIPTALSPWVREGISRRTYFRHRQKEKIPPMKPAPVKLEAPVVDVTPLHLPLLDLKPDQCRFPYGDGPFTFCGCFREEGEPYCWAHKTVSLRGEAA